MPGWIEAILIALILSNIVLLGLSRLTSCIRLVAFQGLLLGPFTCLAQAHALDLRIASIAVASVIVKAIVFPALLSRAIREAGVKREVEPLVGYIASMLSGVLMFGAALWIHSRLPMGLDREMPLMVPGAMMTMFTGLFLIVSRRKALTQALGYLVFENGIYIFGIAAVGEIPTLVEFGVLLDVFVAVFVMGIAIFHINREFDHIDVDRLNQLKD
jgi:hydrogenase-4 component E